MLKINDAPDPFLLEIIKNALDTIADDMAMVIMRTSYSPIIRDSMDYSTAVCDALGQTLAQGLTTPMHLGSFYDAMRALMHQYESRIFPGDVFVFNDPYVASGQHLPDIYIIKPVFFDGKLAAWATTIAHHSDVGGIVPGSNALNATEIIQEGIRLPIVKFVERGVANDAVWDIIRLNVRLPDDLMGDLQSQMAACTRAEQQICELYERYGFEKLSKYFEHLHDYAEQLVRSEIAGLADGDYLFADHIDGLGESPTPVLFNARVTISGDEITVDWSGSSPQVPFGINSPFPFTKAAAYAAVRALMPSHVPNCHGFTRPIKVVAPEGTVVNPIYPGACGARGMSGFRMIDCLFGALSGAAPNRVAADGSGGSTIPTISGWRDGKQFVFCETFMGTWGAGPAADGAEGVPHIGANQSNVPVELIENLYPIRIESYGIQPDTGGPGKYRGGMALYREYRMLNEGGLLNIRSDKRAHPPHGLFGGHDGTPSSNVVTRDGRREVLPTLLSEPVGFSDGDVFKHIMAGGGGRGDPLGRDPQAVLVDVLDEKVSREHAENVYGVILKEDGSAVDENRTAARRKELLSAR